MSLYKDLVKKVSISPEKKVKQKDADIGFKKFKINLHFIVAYSLKI